jgi:apolipoprotein N-acyltransferase
LKKFGNILLVVLSGLLLSVAWPHNGVAAFLFIAFIPLLWLENNFRNRVVKHKKWKLFGCFYLCFLLWNAITTGGL